jgi:hypothetical protein
VRFVYGVLVGVAVGVLATGPDADRTPRVAVRRAAAVQAETPEPRASATTAGPARQKDPVVTRLPSTRTTRRAAVLLESQHYADVLRAADLLARAGRDIEHLDWAFDEAVFRIDRHVAGEPGAEVIEALRAVCRNRIAWRREALEAARSLAERGRHEVQVCARDTVEHLRSRVVLAVDR